MCSMLATGTWRDNHWHRYHIVICLDFLTSVYSDSFGVILNLGGNECWIYWTGETTVLVWGGKHTDSEDLSTVDATVRRGTAPQPPIPGASDATMILSDGAVLMMCLSMSVLHRSGRSAAVVDTIFFGDFTEVLWHVRSDFSRLGVQEFN